MVTKCGSPTPSYTQPTELARGVQEERYTMAPAARFFDVHPATVSRLMAQVRAAGYT